nr:hypothetical protein [Microbacterium sp. B24]
MDVVDDDDRDAESRHESCGHRGAAPAGEMIRGVRDGAVLIEGPCTADADRRDRTGGTDHLAHERCRRIEDGCGALRCRSGPLDTVADLPGRVHEGCRRLGATDVDGDDGR